MCGRVPASVVCGALDGGGRLVTATWVYGRQMTDKEKTEKHVRLGKLCLAPFCMAEFLQQAHHPTSPNIEPPDEVLLPPNVSGSLGTSSFALAFDSEAGGCCERKA